MRFNLKNRPKLEDFVQFGAYLKFNEEWFEGFEKELLAKLEEQKKIDSLDMYDYGVRETIKEILGE